MAGVFVCMLCKAYDFIVCANYLFASYLEGNTYICEDLDLLLTMNNVHLEQMTESFE